MIDILDKKGNPLGMQHDYEYRGSGREKNRDAPMFRANVTWILFAVLFALAGIVSIVKYIEGNSGGTLGSLVLISLFTFGLAALFVWLMISGNRRHKHLLERIGHNKYR